MTKLLDTALDRTVVPGYSKIGYLAASPRLARRRPPTRVRWSASVHW